MEIWKDIKDFEGYQISNYGRVRTYNKVTSNQRYQERHWKNRILKQKVSKLDGRARVCLWKDGKEYTQTVHRLQAIAFLGEPQKSNMTVNHKDGNPLNNTVDNLEWLSRKDNIKYGFEHGQYHNQIQTNIQSKTGRVLNFRSMAECDRFLRRAIGYTSERLSKSLPLIALDGNEYVVI